MQTLQFRQKVGEDGVLRLEVPDLPRGEEVEAVLVMQPFTNGQDAPPKAASLAWVDELYGSIADDTFVEPKELSFETRDAME